MWWCVKNRCFGAFTCGKQEVGPLSEESHLAYGFHRGKMKHNCFFSCVEKDTLTERWGIRRWWEGHTHTPLHPCQTLYCCVQWKKLTTPWTRIRTSFFSRGSDFEALSSWMLWSVHSVMNEVAVKEEVACVDAFFCFYVVLCLNLN